MVTIVNGKVTGFFTRHARACPGHPRLKHNAEAKDVDGRNKSGHDDEKISVRVVCRAESSQIAFHHL
jgi:hypothetical protein